MNILTERLMLRRFNFGDVERFYQIIRDTDVKRYLKGVCVKSKKVLEENIKVYKNADFKNDYYYVIEDKESGTMLGAIIATRTCGNEIEVKYLTGRMYRGNKYMTEALEAFINHVKRNNSQMRLVFTVECDNIPSLKLMQKLGIRLARKDRKHFYFITYGGV